MSFKDIRLQDKAVEFLKRSIETERLPHSLLFFGPEAVGKKLAALNLAKTLNCEMKKPLDCCDSCLSCSKINNLNHPDVTWIEPEGSGNKIKIEKIRAMKEAIALKPLEGRVKFFIIERAHLLADEAANSMLKTLEEPPKDSIIILITDDINRIFPTLRSRCQWVLFSASRPADIRRFLIDKYNLPQKDANFLSHFSGGRIGRAIAMRDEGSLQWKNEVLDRFSKEAIIFDEDPFFFKNKREKILNMMDVIASWYRDLFILKNEGDTSLLVNADRMEDLIAKADSLSLEETREILNETLKARYYVERNVNPKLVLSNLAGRMR
ncbi:MAG: DNA polymerase III subunit delta' [Candidatus Omnitrophica bacterium]|nr:DNA polymerase III subunit delta' [Candidatus Omnitrophota bacterium]